MWNLPENGGISAKSSVILVRIAVLLSVGDLWNIPSVVFTWATDQISDAPPTELHSQELLNRCPVRTSDSCANPYFLESLWCVPSACQISTYTRARCDPCPVDQIVGNFQIEPMRCLEIRVSGELHYLKLTHAIAEPTRYGRIPQIVESPDPDRCSA